ncbi:hypothetical protein DL96DRAFT_206412 [Flagelloscypha sp. PMI_526]|nr:hypothetical protein DL96DRAFT_206412 [Flagelloscypha sp. PMI_526]
MSKHVRSGVLYDLLSDALRFREMNAHAGTAPSSGSDICRAPFLLLSEHKCSFDTGSGDSGSGVGETVGKRKEKSKGKGKEKQAGFSNLELLPPPPLPSTFHAVAKAEYSSELPEVKQRPGRSRTYPDLVPASLSEREQHLPRKIAEFGGDPSSSSTMDVDIAPASSSTTPAEPPPTPGAEWIFIPQVSNRPVPFLDRPVEIRSNTRNDRKSIFGDKVDEEKWSYAPIMMRRPPDPPTSTTSQLIDVNMNSESTLITRMYSCTPFLSQA